MLTYSVQAGVKKKEKKNMQRAIGLESIVTVVSSHLSLKIERDFVRGKLNRYTAALADNHSAPELGLSNLGDSR